MQDKLEAIRAACIAANPSIMELGFGCQLYHSEYGIATIREATGTGNGDTIRLYTDREHKFYSDEVSDGRIYRNFSGWNGKPEWWTILGRPIRLADVLLAIESNRRVMDDSISRADPVYGFDCLGNMVKIPFNRGSEWELLKVKWNLLEDDLRLQSPETLDFLYQLLK